MREWLCKINGQDEEKHELFNYSLSFIMCSIRANIVCRKKLRV